jgi:hypothetical protein
MRQAARWSVYALALLFPLEWRTPLITVGPVGFTTTECLIAVVLGLWAAALLSERRWPRTPPAWVWVPLLLWLGVMTLSTVAAPAARWNAGLFLARSGAGVALGWAAFDLITERAHTRRALAALAGAGLLVGVSGLAEATQAPVVLQVLSGFKVAPTQVGDLLRVSGVLGYATITAVVLELTLLVTFALLLTAKQARERALWGGMMLVMVACLTLTLSRAGVLATVAGAATFAGVGALRGERRLMLGAGAFAALTAAAVGVLFVLNPTTLLRLQTETEQGWYQVSKTAPASTDARPGETVTVAVAVQNEGVRPWEPGEGFMLGYHLYAADGSTITYDGARTPLPGAVAPGEALTLEALITAPAEAGTYTVEWDMVHDTVTWFSWKDAPTTETILTVAGEPVTEALPISVVPPPTDQRVIERTPGRLELWPAAWAMFLDRPLLGVGPDNFRYRYGDYAGLETWNTAIHANNLYLELLADTGLLGFTAFMGFSGALALTLWRGMKREEWLLVLGCGAALAAWYAHGLVDFFYAFTPTYTLYWLVVGVGLRAAEDMRAAGGEPDAHRL